MFELFCEWRRRTRLPRVPFPGWGTGPSVQLLSGQGCPGQLLAGGVTPSSSRAPRRRVSASPPTAPSDPSAWLSRHSRFGRGCRCSSTAGDLPQPQEQRVPEIPPTASVCACERATRSLRTLGTCPRSGGAAGPPTDARPLVGGHSPCSGTPAPSRKGEKNANSS